MGEQKSGRFTYDRWRLYRGLGAKTTWKRQRSSGLKQFWKQAGSKTCGSHEPGCRSDEAPDLLLTNEKTIVSAFRLPRRILNKFSQEDVGLTTVEYAVGGGLVAGLLVTVVLSLGAFLIVRNAGILPEIAAPALSAPPRRAPPTRGWAPTR